MTIKQTDIERAKMLQFSREHYKLSGFLIPTPLTAVMAKIALQEDKNNPSSNLPTGLSVCIAWSSGLAFSSSANALVLACKNFSSLMLYKSYFLSTVAYHNFNFANHTKSTKVDFGDLKLKLWSYASENTIEGNTYQTLYHAMCSLPYHFLYQIGLIKDAPWRTQEELLASITAGGSLQSYGVISLMKIFKTSDKGKQLFDAKMKVAVKELNDLTNKVKEVTQDLQNSTEIAQNTAKELKNSTGIAKETAKELKTSTGLATEVAQQLKTSTQAAQEAVQQLTTSINAADTAQKSINRSQEIIQDTHALEGAKTPTPAKHHFPLSLKGLQLNQIIQFAQFKFENVKNTLVSGYLTKQAEIGPSSWGAVDISKSLPNQTKLNIIVEGAKKAITQESFFQLFGKSFTVLPAIKALFFIMVGSGPMINYIFALEPTDPLKKLKKDFDADNLFHKITSQVGFLFLEDKKDVDLAGKGALDNAQE